MNVSVDKKNNRVFERFTARFPAKIKDTRDEFGTNVFLRDISGQGVNVTSKDRMYVNDKVALEINVPDQGYPMTLRGEVVWTKQEESNFWNVGVKFHKVDLMHVARLYRQVV